MALFAIEEFSKEGEFEMTYDFEDSGLEIFVKTLEAHGATVVVDRLRRCVKVVCKQAQKS